MLLITYTNQLCIDSISACEKRMHISWVGVKTHSLGVSSVSQKMAEKQQKHNVQKSTTPTPKQTPKLKLLTFFESALNQI